jgi:hypothetical protein
VPCTGKPGNDPARGITVFDIWEWERLAAYRQDLDMHMDNRIAEVS